MNRPHGSAPQLLRPLVQHPFRTRTSHRLRDGVFHDHRASLPKTSTVAVIGARRLSYWQSSFWSWRMLGIRQKARQAIYTKPTMPGTVGSSTTNMQANGTSTKVSQNQNLATDFPLPIMPMPKSIDEVREGH